MNKNLQNAQDEQVTILQDRVNQKQEEIKILLRAKNIVETLFNDFSSRIIFLRGNNETQTKQLNDYYIDEVTSLAQQVTKHI